MADGEADLAAAGDPVETVLDEHGALVQRLRDDDTFQDQVREAAAVLAETIVAGNQVLLCGNGGSAADAQHIAAEFSGRFRRDREPVPAAALTTNTSSLTAIANDYGYETVFARQVRAYGDEGDALVGISTSGSSENVIEAVDAADTLGMATVGLTGREGRPLSTKVDHPVQVDSTDTARIQEIHILVGHTWSRIVEDAVVDETG